MQTNALALLNATPELKTNPICADTNRTGVKQKILFYDVKGLNALRYLAQFRDARYLSISCMVRLKLEGPLRT